jgi:hypothetical protein
VQLLLEGLAVQFVQHAVNTLSKDEYCLTGHDQVSDLTSDKCSATFGASEGRSVTLRPARRSLLSESRVWDGGVG